MEEGRRDASVAREETPSSGVLQDVFTHAFPPPSSVVDTMAGSGGGNRPHPFAEIREGGRLRTVAAQPRKTAMLLTAFLACLSVVVFASTLFARFFSELSRNEMVWKHLEMWLEREENVKSSEHE